MKINFFRYRCKAKKNLHFLFVIILVLTIHPEIFSQKINCNAAPFFTADLAKIAYLPEIPGWYKFRPGMVSNGFTFFKKYKKEFGLNENDSMKLVRADKDAAGFTHIRFQQYYKGIKIEGAEYIIHQQPDGFVKSANGKMVYNFNAFTAAAISEASALNKALSVVPSKIYAWQLPSANRLNSAIYNYPKGELVFQKGNPDSLFSPKNFRLCYHFDIYTASSNGYAVYIDAQNGKLINKIPLQSNCSATTTVTSFYGTKNINTFFNSSNSFYYLKDDCTPTVMTVYDDGNDTVFHQNYYFSTKNNKWSSTFDFQSASTSLWCCRRAVDFYSSVFGRNGYDNSGGDVSIYQNAGFINISNTGVHSIYYANASMSFTGGNLRVGNNVGSGNATNADDWNTLDILSHEFTHAVTGSTSNLNYQGESGALNESFSDCLGTYAEYWDGSTTFDWLIGEDRTGGAIRDMSNPNNYSQPDTYSGTYWYGTSGTSDNGGVHTNSGVMNYWFYLLSNGGSGTNDNSIVYNVGGIGIGKAGLITYENDVYYLTSAAQYIDARTGSNEAAAALYGSCSNEALQTGNAWYAVGVGGSQNSSYNANICGVFNTSSNYVYLKGIDLLPVSQNCTVILNPSTAPYGYTISSAKTVIIYPGFHALPGATADIYIDPCDISINKQSYTQNQSVNPVYNKGNPADDKMNTTKNTLTAYPNPATASTTLSFNLAKDETNAVMEVYDINSIKVKQVLLGNIIAGKHNILLNLSNLSTGVYEVVLRLASQIITARVVIAR